MTRLLLINPNTSAATTAVMVGIARGAAPAGVMITGATVAAGVPLITDEDALAAAADAVAAWAATLDATGWDGVIVAAFGDPGLAALRQLLPVPVTGIGEAGMAEAAEGGRRFAVATTTPLLAAAIGRAAAGYGPLFRGVRLTPGDPAALTSDPAALLRALERCCADAVELDGAEAVVIGGGPLAAAARTIALRLAVPVIEPVPAAVRLAVSRAPPARHGPCFTKPDRGGEQG